MADTKLKADNLLNYTEASQILNVSRPTIYTMVDRGELHPIKIADRRYLERKEVERVARERENERIKNANHRENSPGGPVRRH